MDQHHIRQGEKQLRATWSNQVARVVSSASGLPAAIAGGGKRSDWCLDQVVGFSTTNRDPLSVITSSNSDLES